MRLQKIDGSISIEISADPVIGIPLRDALGHARRLGGRWAIVKPKPIRILVLRSRKGDL